MLTNSKEGIISIQGHMTAEPLSPGMAFIVFTQALFPATSCPHAKLVFVSSLKMQLPVHAARSNSMAIIKAVATESRSVVNAADLTRVVVGYMNSFDWVRYLVTVMITVGERIIFWCINWQCLRKKATEAVPVGREVTIVNDEGVDG